MIGWTVKDCKLEKGLKAIFCLCFFFVLLSFSFLFLLSFPFLSSLPFPITNSLLSVYFAGYSICAIISLDETNISGSL